MWLFFGFITFLFVCNAFFTPVSQQTTDPLLVAYFLTQFSFIATYLFLFVIGSIIVIIIFFRSNYDKTRSVLNILFFSSVQTFFVFVGGMLSALVLLWIIAFLHLTIFSIFFNNNPGMLGIVTDTKIIAERLRDNTQQAKIIIADESTQIPIFALAQATSGTDNYYGKYLLSAVPQGAIVPAKSEMPSMMLIDGTLIVTRIDESQLEAMSPVLGYLLVKQYFPLRAIKSYPKLSFMTKETYAEYRREDANKQLEKLDVEIEKMQDMISSLSASLKTNPKQEYKTKKLLTEYETYEKYFTSQKAKMQSSTTHIPNELGVFREPNTIQIIYEPSTSEVEKTVPLIDYFEILTHEYLHYASFISEERRISNAFFEESLTEYFARSAVQESFSANTNLGYPLQAKVLREITKMYTDSELAEIYFTKDEEALASALDRVYGDNFYEDNYVLFETMQFTSNRKQALQVANMIMKKIGGKALTEKDLKSTYTGL